MRGEIRHGKLILSLYCLVQPQRQWGDQLRPFLDSPTELGFPQGPGKVRGKPGLGSEMDMELDASPATF